MVKVIRESEKIQKANRKAEQEQERKLFNIQEDKHSVSVGFTKADMDAISKGKQCLQSKDYYKYIHHSNTEIMRELLSQHNEVDELYLSDTSGAITKMDVQLEEPLHEELSKAAGKAGVPLRDYVRGIIYSRSKQLREEKHNRYLADQQRQRDNRVVRVNLFLDKEVRESIYKKHGKMNDTELAKVVQREALEHLSK